MQTRRHTNAHTNARTFTVQISQLLERLLVGELIGCVFACLRACVAGTEDMCSYDFCKHWQIECHSAVKYETVIQTQIEYS